MTATNLSALTLADLSTRYKEPRIHDLRIAKRLGFGRPRAIRQIIERNFEEFETYGSLATRRGKSRGQAYSEYWLNEPQTLLLCMLSRTERAAAVRREVISVYMDYRRGRAQSAVGATACGGLPADDGRYLVVVCGHDVTEVRPLTGHCVVNGRDETNVTTFLREFVMPHVMPAALSAVLQRMCADASHGNSRGRDALMASMARISADLAGPSNTSSAAPGSPRRLRN